MTERFRASRHDWQAYEGSGMTSLRTRKRMVERLVSQGINDNDVLEAMTHIPRHLFLDQALAHKAYEDVSLPIGHAQTLSQPYIVARMTELLMGGQRIDKVLEIGTGSGYQTSVISALFPMVYTVERIASLQKQARARHNDLSLLNILYRITDGGFGWPSAGPYDAIICTCAPDEIPQDLINQLSEGGRLVIPVGDQTKQDLWLVEKTSTGVRKTLVEPAFFVPLKSGVVRAVEY
ncbi:protein-L-isoaspartate(D-aspartate) O-methyltransferase [Marinicellulosiphila megalodicopiae]|uniref:protein-L-isoaspartate(D-aspartate) O-methyltransferase n=1 Tax=Marinicellulosiphila megalodicopiae TaxID=2724896 RepID=UPI003BAFFFD0